MNQISTIKERLINIGVYKFQELCDAFLFLRNRHYRSFSRTGAHNIKQKTTVGNPDCLIQFVNGLYLFIETTTTEHKGRRLIKKLKKDIAGCLNVEDTGIPIDKIGDIILCYNSNLDAIELEEVNKEALGKMGKVPIHYNLDTLANEIFFHHKNLAKYYLDLPLDTGQVVSLDKFIEEYDNGKQKLATPLAGTFLHREKELGVIRNKLEKNDIVIISGPAGVGKSKLAIKAINEFTKSNLDYNTYAISPKGVDIYSDLESYFKGEENNILLVDDVNRIDKFQQILGFYKGLNLGKLKLVLTVRDYALQNVKDWLSEYKNVIIPVGRFFDKEINAIIEKEPFGVSYLGFQINEIAKGNARLAVMMAMLAKKANSLDSLNNVAELFEQYFESFISDEEAFKDKRVLKALGILSFFYTLPYNDNELLNSIVESFSISGDQLRVSFDKLHDLDLIELNYEHVKIGEQNLSTYFFYKVFIKDKLLSFETLWNTYYEKFEHRFKDTLYPAHQNFGKEIIVVKIKPTLFSYWKTIESNEDKAFKFLNFAWEFLPDECLVYLEEQIELKEKSDIEELSTKYKSNDFVYPYNQEKHLSLLTNFFKDITFFLDALEVSFQLIKKRLEHLPELIYHIDKSNSYFIEEDYSNHFKRQAILIDYLIEEVEKGKLEVVAFLAISKNLLKRLVWSYANEKEAEEDGLDITSVKQSREKVLKTLCNLYNDYKEEVFTIILAFSKNYENGNKYTYEFDLAYLIPWIDENMDAINFRHCYYVREMIRSLVRDNYSHKDFKRLKSKFIHPTYSLFELVNFDRRRGKENYDFEDYKEFEKLKEIDIAKGLTFKSKKELEIFITQYEEILTCKEIQIYSQSRVGEAVLKTNLLSDKEIGFLVFVEFVKFYDKGSYDSDFFISDKAMDSFAIYSDLIERFWEIIDVEGLNEIWKLYILMNIPVEFIRKKHLSRLYLILNDISRGFRINDKSLKKYEKVEPKILLKVLEIIVSRVEEEKLEVILSNGFIVEVSNLIDDIDLLKKVYFQQNQFDDFFDYSGEALLVILQRDNSFLLEFIKVILKKDKKNRNRDYEKLRKVWELPNAEEVLNEVIEYMSNTVNHSLSEHFINSFFKKLANNSVELDKYFLGLIDKYHNNPKIINIAFDVIHNSRKDLFEKAFIIYIHNNQKLEDFKKIKWTDNQIVFPGGAIVGEIRATKWGKLLNLVEIINLGTKTRSIRNHIKEVRDNQLRYAEEGRKRKFLK